MNTLKFNCSIQNIIFYSTFSGWAWTTVLVITCEIFHWRAWIARLPKRQTRNWLAARTIHESSSRWSAHEFLWIRNLDNLRLRLANNCLTNFSRLNNCAWLTNDFWIGNNLLVVDNSWFGHNTLLVNNARLTYDSRLINQFRLANFSRLRNNVLIDHSTLGINHLLLTHDFRWLLNLYVSRSTVLWWTNRWTLRHALKFLWCITFCSTLEIFQRKKKNIFSKIFQVLNSFQYLHPLVDMERMEKLHLYYKPLLIILLWTLIEIWNSLKWFAQ